MHHVKGRSANQKSTRKSAQQDVVPTILIHADSSAGEKEATVANHDVPLKKALHADLARDVHVNNVDFNGSPKSFAVLQILEDSAEMEVDATECKSSIGMGDDELKAPPSVKRSDLNLKAAADCDALPGNQSLDRRGLDSQIPLSDVMLSTPIVEGVYNNSEVEGCNSELEFSNSVALSPADADAHCCPSGSFLINGACSITYVDMVHRGLKVSDAELPSRCAVPFPILEEDRAVALGTLSGVAASFGPAPRPHVANADHLCLEPRACTSVGELRRSIDEMRLHFEATQWGFKF
ncbi:hypothetical protein Nepgr_021101 [Nepenthes gracilis]|uniref:Uncharacterized protein n=1 Tax=Nepenthes gracilis TaxID=150966 RepID=A0AAD3XWX3_NEPGR|nr:hypothetical protein Nepgr_021101 [Nepenthes gracilis]